jgi:hypothetical protein
MSSLQNIPLWAVALALAAIAPWCVGVLQSILEERRRERTRKLLRGLGLPVVEQGSARGEPTERAKPRANRDSRAGPDEDP